MMTPEAFRRWLDEMKDAKLIRFDVDAARLLGVSQNTVTAFKRRGVSGDAAERTAYACRALLHRLEPYV